jgi:uncharacterized membrane protein HdeD (DUF308 family)
MLQTLITNWWLLGLRGLLALVFSVMTFMMRSSAETFTLREFAMKGMVIFLGMLALTAGACTVAAGIWRASTGKWWLLVADGVIVSAAGLALILATSFTLETVIYILVVLAAAIGFVELLIARGLRRHLPDEWFLGLGGAASLGFAVAFLLIKPEEAGAMFLWLGSYSGFSALCMFALAFRLRGLRASIHKIAQSVSS